MRSEGGLPRAPSTRSEGGDPHNPREVFHALRGRRKVIHTLQGGSSMRCKGGDPHAAREVIRTLQGRGSTRSEGGVPRASMGRDPRGLRATIHGPFRFLILINPDRFYVEAESRPGKKPAATTWAAEFLLRGRRKQGMPRLVDQLKCSTRDKEKTSQTSDYVLVSMRKVAYGVEVTELSMNRVPINNTLSLCT
jgi:hypothetical protein